MAKRTKDEINNALGELRKFIDNDSNDRMEVRIAYECEQAIRWATEDTTDWPSPLQSARDAAILIRKDLNL